MTVVRKLSAVKARSAEAAELLQATLDEKEETHLLKR